MKKVLVICILLLFVVACTSAQIVTSINVAIKAAEVALPIVAGAAGINSTEVAVLMQYLQDANIALSSVSQIVASGGTQAQIATKITEALAGIVAGEPNLQGMPSSIASAIQSVADSLANLLEKYGAKKGALSVSSEPIKLSSSDLEALTAAQAKAQKNLLAIKQWKATHK